MTGPAFLGIDGGGTKTDLAIVDRNGKVLARGKGPTSNQAVVGIEEAIDVLVTLIRETTAKAALTVPLAAGWIGLAGADRPDERAAFTMALSALVDDLRFTNDAELVLAGTPDGTGIALIAGTGSIACARTVDGDTGRSGGWGHIFGDEGSAYAIAVAGLRAVAAAVDGRGPATALTAPMLDHWRADTPQQLIPRVYHPEMRKSDIAAASPVVVEIAATGDAVAEAILDQAADDLATMVMSLARRMAFTDPPEVACTGGVILQAQQIRARIESRLDPAVVQTRLRPVEDIALSAARAVQLQATENSR